MSFKYLVPYPYTYTKLFVQIDSLRHHAVAFSGKLKFSNNIAEISFSWNKTALCDISTGNVQFGVKGQNLLVLLCFFELSKPNSQAYSTICYILKKFGQDRITISYSFHRNNRLKIKIIYNNQLNQHYVNCFGAKLFEWVKLRYRWCGV